MRAPLSLLLTVGVVSCTAPQHNFASMTEAELLAFNADRPVLKQIYCRKMKPTSSHIRRNVCKSVEDWVSSQRTHAHNRCDEFRLLRVRTHAGRSPTAL